jgi:glucokinase
MYILGFDIGGTKCAALVAEWDGENVMVLDKVRLKTDTSIPASEMIHRLIDAADGILTKKPEAIGISSGGPLDSERGVIMSPPNLPGWDNVEIVGMMEGHYGVKARLLNDANACAVAEWKFGAGRGTKNMVFLTFGTGLGAGLILDGRLYNGTNGNAGEVGHVRLDEDGPVGFGKAGSFEGFCSGGGIARLAWKMALDGVKNNTPPAYYREGMTQSDVSAMTVAEAAKQGDVTALEVYRISAERLGRGLAIIVDVLNPERIVIGSVFARSQELFLDTMQAVLKEEALSCALDVCSVVPAQLGDSVGDYAAIAAALS